MNAVVFPLTFHKNARPITLLRSKSLKQRALEFKKVEGVLCIYFSHYVELQCCTKRALAFKLLSYKGKYKLKAA